MVQQPPTVTNTSDYIQSYDGNPLTYHVFKISFDHIVYPIKDYQHKLTQLLRFTRGDAHEAVQGCAIIGEKESYDRDIEILKSRFGD